MTLSALDITILIVAALFAVAGWQKGFMKKFISLAALITAFAIAASFGLAFAESVFVPLGLRPGVAIFFAYFTIIGGIMFAQAVMYSLFVRDIVEGALNHLGGMLMGIAEAALSMSVALIILSAYVGIPSEETKATSQLYLPVKNLAPHVYDTAFTYFPEMEDFYQRLYKAFAEHDKPGEKTK
ncbi:MAG TPA: CvpA family protein [Bacteroidota bacterium]|nr:CvpA family protein [Bacteroidota bacterium]